MGLPSVASIKRQIEREGPRFGLTWTVIGGKVYAAERVKVRINHGGLVSMRTRLHAVRRIEKPGDWMELFRLRLSRRDCSVKQRLQARKDAEAKAERERFDPIRSEMKADARRWMRNPVTVLMGG